MSVARVSIGGAMMRTLVATVHDVGCAILEAGDFTGMAAGAKVDVKGVLAKGAG